MRILLIPPTLNFLNLGDVALVMSAVSRLRTAFPDALIHVPAGSVKAARELACHCPGVIPLRYRSEWHGGGRILSRMSGWMARWGKTAGALLRERVALRRGDPDGFAEYMGALRGSQLVVGSGAGGLNDLFGGYARLLIGTLELAQQLGKTTAVFSQGIGPMRDEALLRRTGHAFRRLELVGLRERLHGFPLVERMGVRLDRVVDTGDDAVEMAWARRPAMPGMSLGVNVRLSEATGMNASVATPLGEVLRRFARSRDTEFVTLPVARSREVDRLSIEKVVGDLLPDDPADVDSPFTVIDRAGRCRMVITATYHAGVFALAQGVPVVCLSFSEYFDLKFRGLAAHFGDGCRVVDLGRDGFEGVSGAMQELWGAAPGLRNSLVEAAERQVRASREAYERLRRRVSGNGSR